MEAIRSSETSVLIRATRCHLPEDDNYQGKDLFVSSSLVWLLLAVTRDAKQNPNTDTSSVLKEKFKSHMHLPELRSTGRSALQPIVVIKFPLIRNMFEIVIETVERILFSLIVFISEAVSQLLHRGTEQWWVR
jgi:hypothetical protein